MLTLATRLHLDGVLRLDALRFNTAAEFDPNSVTPGVVGFLVTFGLAAAVVLLVLDMVRRVRRLRYREEISAQLDAEEEAAGLDAEAAALDRDDTPDGQRPPTG